MGKALFRAMALVAGGMAVGGALAGQDIDLPAFYVSGKTYSRLAEPVRFGYVNGLSDGIKMGFVIGRSGGKGDWFACAELWPMGQAKRMFETYIGAHPEKWRLPASVLFWNAANGVCTK